MNQGLITKILEQREGQLLQVVDLLLREFNLKLGVDFDLADASIPIRKSSASQIAGKQW